MVRVAPLTSRNGVSPSPNTTATTSTNHGIYSKPRRILGFNPAVGRGFVLSTDQRYRPEFLFLDTPSHPNLQMVCSRIIDQDGARLTRDLLQPQEDEPVGIRQVTCEGLTFQFAVRHVSPQNNTRLFRLLKDVYWESPGDDNADDHKIEKYGMTVMIPLMAGTSMAALWGSSPRRHFHVPITTKDLDDWICSVAMDDDCPL